LHAKPAQLAKVIEVLVAVDERLALDPVTVDGEPLHVPEADKVPVQSAGTIQLVPVQVAPEPDTVIPVTDPVPVGVTVTEIVRVVSTVQL
jgi:hypothetical protein